MKIIQITNAPPWEGGGLEQVVAKLSLEFIKRRHKVEIIANGQNYEERVWQKIKVYVLPVTQRYIIKHYIFIRKAVEFIRFKTISPDVIIAHGEVGAVFKYLQTADCLKVQIYHGTQAQAAPDTIPQYGWKKLATKIVTLCLGGLEKTAFKYSNQKIAVSKGVAKEIDKFYGRGKVEVINNGVNTREFSPVSREEKDKLRKKLKLPANELIGLSIGSSQYGKGLDVTQAAAKLSKTKVIALGYKGGVYGEFLINAGRVAPEEINRYYQAVDFFILPSRYEAHSLSILEAMSSGLPVIVSVATKSDQIKDGKNGYIVEGFNPQDYAEIITLIKNKKNRQSVAEKARNSVLKMDWKNQADKYLEFLQKHLKFKSN